MRHSPKQDLSQGRLHGLGSEESFVPEAKVADFEDSCSVAGPLGLAADLWIFPVGSLVYDLCLLTSDLGNVPVVQRKEQGFPKTKVAFHHTSSAVLPTTQTTFC